MKNAITAIPSVPATMTSREIAELTGKRHDNVMRDIETQLTELLGEEGLLKFEDTHRNEQNGQTYKMYRLPKRECLAEATKLVACIKAGNPIIPKFPLPNIKDFK